MSKQTTGTTTSEIAAASPVRNAVWLLGAEIVGKISNFALVVIVARELGATAYGYFNFALSFFPLFLIFANWGMDSALIREISRDRGRVSELLASAFALLGGLGLAGLGLALASATFFVEQRGFYLAVTLLGVALFVDQQASLIGAVFKAFERMEFHAFVVLANRIGSTLLTLLVVALHESLNLVALAYLAGSCGALVYGRIVLARRFPPVHHRSATKRGVRELLRVGAPLGLGGFLNMAVYRLDTVLLQALKGPLQVATYGIAYRFFETFLFVSWALANVALPRMSRSQRMPETARTFELTAGALVAFYLPLAVVAPFVATFVVTVLFSERYSEAGAVVPVLIAAALFYGLAHLGRMGAIALGKRNRVAWVAATTLLVNLTLNIYAIPRYGYEGAAWTTLGTEVLEALLLVGLFVRLEGATPRLRVLAIPAIASMGLFAVLALGGLRDLAAIVVAVVLYPPLLVGAAMVLAPGEARELGRMLRRPRAPLDARTLEAP